VISIKGQSTKANLPKVGTEQEKEPKKTLPPSTTQSLDKKTSKNPLTNSNNYYIIIVWK